MCVCVCVCVCFCVSVFLCLLCAYLLGLLDGSSVSIFFLNEGKACVEGLCLWTGSQHDTTMTGSRLVSLPTRHPMRLATGH